LTKHLHQTDADYFDCGNVNASSPGLTAVLFGSIYAVLGACVGAIVIAILIQFRVSDMILGYLTVGFVYSIPAVGVFLAWDQTRWNKARLREIKSRHAQEEAF